MPKQRYLCIHRSPVEQEHTCASKASTEEMYASFLAWKEKYQANILDMGGQLGREGKVVTTEHAIDGPFVEAKEIVGGYMVVEADSFEEAVGVVQAIPGVSDNGGSVEIRPISTP